MQIVIVRLQRLYCNAVSMLASLVLMRLVVPVSLVTERHARNSVHDL